MNCISSLKSRSLLLLVLTGCAACAEQVAEAPAAGDSLEYRIDYVIGANPPDGTIDITLRLRQSRDLLREVVMLTDARYGDFSGDGELQATAGEVRWLPPAQGGALRWSVNVANERNGGGYDAWLGMDWGVFRAEDIVPRARTRTLKGAYSDTRLRFELPRDWSVATEYYGKSRRYQVDKAQRRFDQPSGWIVIGDIGVRRETIAGTRVAVAGPVGQSVRRMDMLALLRWTLPELSRVLPAMPPRLTVISAGEPMWRGGLSAPQSLFVHADRPLISENGTSTLLHEVLHIAFGMAARDGYDWIIEGLAEYYTLQILQRSGTISGTRLQSATADLAEWAESSSTLCGQVSKGATTARAVGVFAALDEELRSKSDGSAGLDDVVTALVVRNDPVDLDLLSAAVAQVLGDKADVLHIDNLPGCRNIRG